MSDPIERQTAIDEFWKLDIELRPSAIDAIINMLRQLPSTQTETPCYLGGPCEYQNEDIKLPSEQPTQTNTLNELEKLDCDRQAVKEWLRKWEGYIDEDTIARMQYRVCDIPFAQPEIIRCGQCKYAEVADQKDSQDGYTCQFHRGSIWFSGSFCSWAERRTDE